MSDTFWHDKWRSGQTGFHQAEVHEDLVREGADWLGPAPGGVLVPLCGKTCDLAWLAARAPVLGVELVQDAIDAFFAERGLMPTGAPLGEYTAWSAPELPSLTLLQGDIFALPSLGERLSAITHIWDRAALVALPAPVRARYAAMLRASLPGRSVLLNTFDIGPDKGDGPPFSVVVDELEALYAGCERVETHRTISEASPGLKARGVSELLTVTSRLTLRA